MPDTVLQAVLDLVKTTIEGLTDPGNVFKSDALIDHQRDFRTFLGGTKNNRVWTIRVTASPAVPLDNGTIMATHNILVKAYQTYREGANYDASSEKEFRALVYAARDAFKPYSFFDNVGANGGHETPVQVSIIEKRNIGPKLYKMHYAEITMTPRELIPVP